MIAVALFDMHEYGEKRSEVKRFKLQGRRATVRKMGGVREEDGWFPSKGRNREANRSSQEVQHLKVLLCYKN
ncbi:unnamed protein product [Brassica oleracea]